MKSGSRTMATVLTKWVRVDFTFHSFAWKTRYCKRKPLRLTGLVALQLSKEKILSFVIFSPGLLCSKVSLFWKTNFFCLSRCILCNFFLFSTSIVLYLAVWMLLLSIEFPIWAIVLLLLEFLCGSFENLILMSTQCHSSVTIVALGFLFQLCHVSCGLYSGVATVYRAFACFFCLPNLTPRHGAL